MTTIRDFRPTLGVVAEDLNKFLSNEPTAINGLLYRANRSIKEQTVTITDKVGSMEASDKVIAYFDPVSCFGVELPFDFDVDMETAGDHANEFAAEPKAMLLTEDPIPKGSVFVYDEYDSLSDSVVRRIMYVATSKPISKHPGAGVIYFMLPFLDYDGTFAS